MLGNLTIDKASMNISYFLYSIILVFNNHGKISRKDFIEKMAEFVGISSTIDQKENRTPYNKTKLPRYFGLIDIEEENETSYLRITNRGKRVINLIDSDDNALNKDKYFIKKDNQDEFIEIITESVVFDSFGRNNCGAEQSNTDIEAPKILFKLIIDLEKVTSEEFCYVIYGLNTGLFSNYNDALAKLISNRKINKYDYKKELTNLNVFNIAKDCKLINIFKDKSFGFLTSSRDDFIKKTFYYLKSNLPAKTIAMFKRLNYFYKPIRMTFLFDKKQNTYGWINQTILGRNSNEKFVFHLINSEQNDGKIEEAICLAFNEQKKNVYITFDYKDDKEIKSLFGKYATLINTIEDINDIYNGWSKNSLVDPNIYNLIVKSSKKAKNLLKKDEIRFPANIQLIGVQK